MPSWRSARAVSTASCDSEPGADVEATLDRLRSLPGIGEWTAQYIAMRALSWPDAFPHTDYGVLKAMDEKNPRKALEHAAQLATVARLRSHAPVEISGGQQTMKHYTYHGQSAGTHAAHCATKAR